MRESRETTPCRARRPTVHCGSQDVGATDPAPLPLPPLPTQPPMARCPHRLLTRHSVAVQVVPDGLLQLVVRGALLEALAEKVPQVLAQLSSCRKRVKHRAHQPPASGAEPRAVWAPQEALPAAPQTPQAHFRFPPQGRRQAKIQRQNSLIWVPFHILLQG